MSSFTIIIPAYNAREWIDRAITSALEQVDGVPEIFVVDDGSTDNTLSHVQYRYGAKVRVISSANRGPSHARNLGVKNSSGDWIIFLDSDDLLLPDYLGAIKNLAGNADLILSSWMHHSIDGTESKIDPPELADRFVFEFVTANRVAIQAAAIRRSFVDRVGGFDESLRQHEDWDLWLKVLQLSPRIQSITQPLSVVMETALSNSSPSLSFHLSAIEVLRRGRSIVASEVEKSLVSAHIAHRQTQMFRETGILSALKSSPLSWRLYRELFSWFNGAVLRRIFTIV